MVHQCVRLLVWQDLMMEGPVSAWLAQYTAKHVQQLLIIVNHAIVWEVSGTISVAANA